RLARRAERGPLNLLAAGSTEPLPPGMAGASGPFFRRLRGDLVRWLPPGSHHPRVARGGCRRQLSPSTPSQTDTISDVPPQGQPAGGRGRERGAGGRGRERRAGGGGVGVVGRGGGVGIVGRGGGVGIIERLRSPDLANILR